MRALLVAVCLLFGWAAPLPADARPADPLAVPADGVTVRGAHDGDGAWASRDGDDGAPAQQEEDDDDGDEDGDDAALGARVSMMPPGLAGAVRVALTAPKSAPPPAALHRPPAA